MRVSRWKSNYKFILSAGAKAKSVTNNLPLLSVLAVSGLLFNGMKYDYSSHVLIPGNGVNGSSLGGYYTVNGSGHNFNMLMIISGN